MPDDRCVSTMCPVVGEHRPRVDVRVGRTPEPATCPAGTAKMGSSLASGSCRSRDTLLGLWRELRLLLVHSPHSSSWAE